MRHHIIEGCNNYTIYEDGRVVNNKDNTLIKVRNTNETYLCTIKNNKGRSVTKNMALLVATYFLPTRRGYELLEYIDGDSSNYKASNLQWALKRSNKFYIHYSYLLDYKDVVKVKGYGIEDIVYYPNIATAAIRHGVDKDVLRDKLKNNDGLLNSIEVKFLLDDSPWQIEQNSRKKSDINILVRDIKANKIVRYDSVNRAALHLGVSAGIVNKWLTYDDYIMLPGSFQLSVNIEYNDWLDLDELDDSFELFDTRKMVRVTNIKTNDVNYFLSYTQAANVLKINSANIKKAIRENIPFGDYLFEKYR